MSKVKEKFITLTSDDGDIEVEVIEQTILNGTVYLLVADKLEDGEEEGDCYILKDISKENDEDAEYILASDEEADEVFEVFEKMLKEDVDMIRR